MPAGLKTPTATTGYNDGQRTILVRSAIAEARAVGEDGVVQQRGAVGFLNGVHLFQQIGKLLHMEMVHLL